MRGEDLPKIGTTNGVAGSPPRAWGGQQHAGRRQAVHGLTLTCVRRARWRRVLVRLTPTFRGTDRPGRRPSQATEGSPPWCVGRTRKTPGHRGSGPVHPHVRWGGLDREFHPPDRDGLTPPAWADHQPCARSRKYSGSPPHAWGGPVTQQFEANIVGSSSRAWGGPRNSRSRGTQRRTPHAWGGPAERRRAPHAARLTPRR